MALAYKGSPEELNSFKNKFLDHVYTMEGHSSALEIMQQEFALSVKESATGTAIQAAFTEALGKGRELRNLLADAANALGATAGEIQAQDDSASQRVGVGDFDYNFS